MRFAHTLVQVGPSIFSAMPAVLGGIRGDMFLVAFHGAPEAAGR